MTPPIEVWLIVTACLAPNFVECKWMEAIERPDPITCQLDRIPKSIEWRYRVQDVQGFYNWSVFTSCELVNAELNGRRG